MNDPINPFLNGEIGRREWNDRYHNLSNARRNWQLAFAGCLLVVIVQGIFMGMMAMRSSIQPFVVETNRGMPYAIQPVRAVALKDPQLINYALNQFIINVRSIVHDPSAQKNLLNKVYAYSAGMTKNFLRDYFLAHDPFKSSNQYSVSIQIINSLPIGKNTWQITWDETKTDLISHQSIEKSRWMAQLHYNFGEVNPHFMTENPFGIYITELTWSQSQIHE